MLLEDKHTSIRHRSHVIQKFKSIIGEKYEIGGTDLANDSLILGKSTRQTSPSLHCLHVAVSHLLCPHYLIRA